MINRRRLDLGSDYRKESSLQKQVVAYLRVYEAMGRLMFFSIPNEAKRSYALANTLKAMGMRRGVSDLEIILPGAVAFLELKAPGETPNEGQLEFMKTAASFGVHCFVADNFDSAKGYVDGLVKAFPQRRAA